MSHGSDARGADSRCHRFRQFRARAIGSRRRRTARRPGRQPADRRRPWCHDRGQSRIHSASSNSRHLYRHHSLRERDRSREAEGRLPERVRRAGDPDALPYSGTEGTHDLSRNHINVLSCAAIVALPGEAGTASEVELAIRYGKPVIAYSPDSALVKHFPPSVRRASNIDDVKDFLKMQLAPSP